MKLTRYWLPALLGFTFGFFFSLRISGTPMRDLLANATVKAGDSTATTDHKAAAPSSPLAEDERFARFFSAVQEPRALKRRSLLNSAIGDLGTGDMAPLIERLESIRGKQDTNGLVEAVLERWFEIDHAGATAWIRSHQVHRSYQLLWAKLDPAAALREFGQNPQFSFSEEILFAASAKLAGGDDEERGRLLLQLPESPVRNRVLTRIADEMAAGDPLKALAFAQKIPDQTLRMARITHELMQWARKDADAAAKEITAKISEIQNTWQFGNLMTTVIAGLAQKDPNRAFEWIATLPESQRSGDFYATAARVWAAKQPIDALQWCADNGIDSVSAFPGNEAIVATAMRSKPMETLQWIQAQPAGGMRDALLEKALVTQLVYRGEPTDAQRELTIQALQSLPENSQVRAASGIAQIIGSYDDEGSQISRWLENFRDPALRSATITGAAQMSAMRDEENAKSKVPALYSQGPDRDAALRGLAIGYWKNESDRIAADLAAQISDQTLRFKILDAMMVGWLQKDKAAATHWLQNTPSIPTQQSTAWQKEAGGAF